MDRESRVFFREQQLVQIVVSRVRMGEQCRGGWGSKLGQDPSLKH